MTEAAAVAGVLLAGGRSTRMGGGDKGLRLLAGRPLIERVAARARPQVAHLVLNANGDAARFASLGLPVVADVVEGYAGPLAGVLTALEWTAAHRPAARWLASFAVDAPFLPLDLVARLAAAVGEGGADLACAASGGRTHPVFGLWPVAMRHALRRALVDEGVRKIDLWTGRYRVAEVEFACDPFDPFFNVNAPDDLAEAERLAALAGEAPPPTPAAPRPAPRIRVLIGDATALGPGKADLLERIGATGSIAKAARAMGMSYRRAWLLVEAMNRRFRAPLIEAVSGGRGGGGSRLTGLGRDVLARYRRMEGRAAASVEGELEAFAELLAEPPGEG